MLHTLRLSAFLPLSAAVMLCLQPALAEDAIINAGDPSTVAEVIAADHRTIKSGDDDEGVYLEITNPKQHYFVNFYECDNGTDCQHFTLTASLGKLESDIAALMADWNGNEPWGMMFSDEDTGVWLFQTVNAFGGLTSDNINDSVSWYEGQLEALMNRAGIEKMEGAQE